ncbi:MAG: helicase-associated domain-containing protein [Anaerolineales bacterium]|nr:helicase-associated domain-containing protein [Anaerolineales bacterium]
MPDLAQSLQGRDLGHLRIIAELWGLDFSAPDARVGILRLSALLQNPNLIEEGAADLNDAARIALQDLLDHDGRLPWALFTRRHGVLREMGAARRNRERPHRSADISATEALWYRGLIGRTFFETPKGAEEYAFIPVNLIPLIPYTGPAGVAAPGRPASPAERAYPIPADDSLLDDTCTLLAAVRLGEDLGAVTPFLYCAAHSPYPLTAQALHRLLTAAGLLDAAGAPVPEPVRAQLEASRGEALASLVGAWLDSSSFNELLLLPGLCAEGEWRNDPLHTRRVILDFLSTVRPDVWWSLPTFISAIKQTAPDFQRPAGDYDSWYLRDEASGEFLRGFEHWEQVDGALLCFMICGPLHWLGILDLAAAAEPGQGELPLVTAFRFSAWASDLLAKRAPQGLAGEDARLSARSDGRVMIPIRAPRPARYQLARFCAWEKPTPTRHPLQAYIYRLTPASLERARLQGLRVEHLLALLYKYGVSAPPSLAQALRRWEEAGPQARLEQVTLLRVRRPEILTALRAGRAKRFLGDPLSPTAVIVKAGAAEKVIAVLLEMGYLGEIDEIKKSPE